MYAPNWEVNDGVRKVKEDAVVNMAGWVGEFYEEKGVGKPWEV
jgi:hypothetical protein